MSYLCDYVSLLAKKKKKKKTSNMHRLSTTRGAFFLFFFFLSSLHTGGTVFNFEAGGGDQSELPHASLQVNTKRTR